MLEQVYNIINRFANNLVIFTFSVYLHFHNNDSEFNKELISMIFD